MIKDKNMGLIVALIIFFGVTISNVFIYFSYERMITESTQAIAELSATNIYSEINNELTKPIYVALTMANDTFVANWLRDEQTSDPQDIVDYLLGVQNKYTYSSTFLISSASLDYYRQTGFLKTISPTDDHDVWYYDFIARDNLYELDVDVDEANGVLTIFVNAKLYDADDTLLGIVGVGVEMDYIQELILLFEQEYELEAFLIDHNGLIQSHTETAYIEHRLIFEEPNYAIHQTHILNTFDEMVVLDEQERIIISRYVDELDWFIIVVKETNVLVGFFQNYLFVNAIMTISIVGIIAYLVDQTVRKHHARLARMAMNDFLTNLLNRRGFDAKYKELRKQAPRSALVFMADIDHFKMINDQFGHVVGDETLCKVATLLSDTLGPDALISRWGGDEFAGVVVGEPSELKNWLETLLTTISKASSLSNHPLTISIGATATHLDEPLDVVLKRADEALSKAKQQGGNQVHRHDGSPSTSS